MACAPRRRRKRRQRRARIAAGDPTSGHHHHHRHHHSTSVRSRDGDLEMDVEAGVVPPPPPPRGGMVRPSAPSLGPSATAASGAGPAFARAGSRTPNAAYRSVTVAVRPVPHDSRSSKTSHRGVFISNSHVWAILFFAASIAPDIIVTAQRGVGFNKVALRMSNLDRLSPLEAGSFWAELFVRVLWWAVALKFAHHARWRLKQLPYLPTRHAQLLFRFFFFLFFVRAAVELAQFVRTLFYTPVLAAAALETDSAFRLSSFLLATVYMAVVLIVFAPPSLEAVCLATAPPMSSRGATRASNRRSVDTTAQWLDYVRTSRDNRFFFLRLKERFAFDVAQVERVEHLRLVASLQASSTAALPAAMGRLLRPAMAAISDPAQAAVSQIRSRLDVLTDALEGVLSLEPRSSSAQIPRRVQTATPVLPRFSPADIFPRMAPAATASSPDDLVPPAAASVVVVPVPAFVLNAAVVLCSYAWEAYFLEPPHRDHFVRQE